ncbi:MAG: hypothetical protein HW391_572 [Chloroflexi bacterium]|nr:hypothetical protein [Chloroflexota bacterium]
MSLILAGVALAVTVGAVIAVSTREARVALIGLVVTLGLGPFLADPLPEPAVLGVRVISGLLIVFVLQAVARGDHRGLGSRIGWPAEALLAGGAAITGLALGAGLGGIAGGAPDPPGGPNDLLIALTPAGLGLAAGLGSMAVGLAPALLGRSGLRVAIGLVVLCQGVILTRTGAAGTPGSLEQVGLAGLLLALGIAGGVLAARAVPAAPSGSELPVP